MHIKVALGYVKDQLSALIDVTRQSLFNLIANVSLNVQASKKG